MYATCTMNGVVNCIVQLESSDVFDIMLTALPPLPSVRWEESSPSIMPHPRLAMLDASTVLQLTSEASLTSVTVMPALMCLAVLLKLCLFHRNWSFMTTASQGSVLHQVYHRFGS